MYPCTQVSMHLFAYGLLGMKLPKTEAEEFSCRVHALYPARCFTAHGGFSRRKVMATTLLSLPLLHQPYPETCFFLYPTESQLVDQFVTTGMHQSNGKCDKHVSSFLMPCGMKICTPNASPCLNLQFHNTQTGQLACAHPRCLRAFTEPKGAQII